MNRLPDWRERLESFIETRHQAGFSWATNNGAVFAAAAVEAMTGAALYPQELLTAADSADVQAEVDERALLAALHKDYLAAGRELALRRATAVSQAAAYDHALRAEAEEAVEEQETVLSDLAASMRQQHAAVAVAAQKVSKPILEAVEANGGIVAMVTARLGEPLPGILLAQYGDVVMATVTDGQPCLGICLGGHCAFVSEEGLSKVRLGRCTAAWHLPTEDFAHVRRLTGTHGWEAPSGS